MNFTKSILFLEIFIFENTWENRCQNGNMIYLMNAILFFFAFYFVRINIWNISLPKP